MWAITRGVVARLLVAGLLTVLRDENVNNLPSKTVAFRFSFSSNLRP